MINFSTLDEDWDDESLDGFDLDILDNIESYLYDYEIDQEEDKKDTGPLNNWE